MNKIELQDNGFPMTAKTLRFLQETNRVAFEALARTYGNSILYGVERAGSSWTDGAIIYNGEIVPFVGGGVAGTYFRIDEAVENAVYKSGVSLPAYFTRVAKPQATNTNGGVLISSLGRVNEVGQWIDCTFQAGVSNNIWGTSEPTQARKINGRIFLKGS